MKIFDLFKIKKGSAVQTSDPDIQALTNKDPEVRMQAAQKLGTARNKKAIAALTDLLNDKYWFVQKAAVGALGNIQTNTAIEALLKALRSDNTNVRIYTAEVLGGIKEKKVIGPLLELLNDESPVVQEAANEALIKLIDLIQESVLFQEMNKGTKEFQKYIKRLIELKGKEINGVNGFIQSLNSENIEIRKAALVSLQKIGGTRAINGIIKGLKDPENSIREKTEEILRDLGPQAVDLLIDAMEDHDAKFRVLVAHLLGDLKDKRAVDTLIHASKDRNKDVQRAVANALGKIGDVRAVEPLIHLIKNSEGEEYKVVLHALWELGDSKATDIFLSKLKDSNPDLRKYAIEFLGKTRNPNLITPIGDALSDEVWYVQVAAVKALQGIGGQNSINLLIKALKNNSSNVRQEAALSLGELRERSAVKPLLDAYGDGIIKVNENIIQALGEIGDISCIPFLTQLLTDKQIDIQRGAFHALTNIAKTDTGIIIQALNDSNSQIRMNLIQILIDLKAVGVDRILELLQKGSGSEKALIIRALGELNDARAIPPLLQELQSPDSEIQKIAYSSLWKLGYPPVIDSISKTLHDSDPMVRINSIMNLETFGDQRAMAYLMESLKDTSPEVRQISANALGRLKRIDSIEGIMQAIAEETTPVKYDLLWALSEIGTSRAIPVLYKTLFDPSIEARTKAKYYLERINDPKAKDVLLQAQDEKNLQDATLLCGFLNRMDANGNLPQPVIDIIKKIGREICEDGGKSRMIKVAYKVEAISKRALYLAILNHMWDGICGWQK